MINPTNHILSETALQAGITAAKVKNQNKATQLLAGMAEAGRQNGDGDFKLSQQKDAEDQKSSHLPYMQRPNNSHIVAQGSQGVAAAWALVKALEWDFVLYKETDKEDHPIWGSFVELHVMVFDDQSFICFDDGTVSIADYAGTAAITLYDTHAENIGHDIKKGTVTLLEATIPLVNTGESLFEEVRERFHDEDDPPVDETESGYQDWNHEDVEKAEKLIQLAFIHLAQSPDAQAEVGLESFDAGEGVVPHYTKDVDGTKLAELIESKLDKTPFNGYSYEYNDGAYDRMSGFSKDATVTYLDLHLSCFTAHQIMEMKTEAKALFEPAEETV